METENAQWFILSQLGINNSIHKNIAERICFLKNNKIGESMQLFLSALRVITIFFENIKIVQISKEFNFYSLFDYLLFKTGFGSFSKYFSRS